MRGHRWRLATGGAVLGLAMAVAMAVTPASAAKPGGEAVAVSASYSCATFEGLVLTQSSVSYMGVALQAGETITARVSPASPGDEIIMTTSIGSVLNWEPVVPATEGKVFTAPATGSYHLAWSLEAAGTRPPSLTWTFDCSSASGGSGGTAPVADADRDGVADSADACAATALPDSVSKPTSGRYYARSDGRFLDGLSRSANLTVIDAGGCSAAQIAKALRLSPKDARSGITLTQLQNWAGTH